jgi:anti-sigma-K factor RskA
VRERLLARVREDARRPGRTEASGPAGAAGRARSRAWLPLALAASLVLAFGLGLYSRSLRSALRQERDARVAVSARLDVERRTRGTAEARVAAAQRAVEALTAPGTRAVTLAGLGPAPGAKAKAFLVPERGELLLFVYDLPPLPPGRTYQLWVIVGANPPVSAGTFEVLPDGSARFDARAIPPLEGKVTVAVTQEPAGGVPQPTGPMVLAGS